MNIANVRYPITCIIVSVLFFGCTKIDFRDPSKHCKILETSDRIFTYNELGNPVEFAYKVDPDLTGRATVRFTYDSRQRLIEYTGFKTHKITYNARGTAISDSIHSNYAGQDIRIAVRFFYDHFSRISKTVSTTYHSDGQDLPLPHEEEVQTFNYDNRGNLILPDTDGTGNRAYDNKPGILRTNPIFMLIHRNYSLNNPKINTQYNNDGLPDTWDGLFFEGGATGMIYQCEHKNGK